MTAATSANRMPPAPTVSSVGTPAATLSGGGTARVPSLGSAGQVAASLGRRNHGYAGADPLGAVPDFEGAVDGWASWCGWPAGAAHPQRRHEDYPGHSVATAMTAQLFDWMPPATRYVLLPPSISMSRSLLTEWSWTFTRNMRRPCKNGWPPVINGPTIGM